jgi:hypothetical protein
MTWPTIIVGGGIVVGLVILLAGQKTVTGTVGFDPTEMTFTHTGDTNTSGQGTP